MSRYLPIIILSLFFLGAPQASLAQSEQSSAVIYYNEACAMCAEYIDQELIKTLKEQGVSDIVKKDYINDRAIRKELGDLNEKIGIPVELQGHFSIFVNDNIILQGHVPAGIIADIFDNQGKFEKIIVFQDKMHDAKDYQVWAFKGEIKKYAIDVPVTEYLNWFTENEDKLETPAEVNTKQNFKTLFPLVLLTGFIDGFNPCAFAVLLFFIAFLFTLQKTVGHILKLGLVYIAVIYLTYLGIGVGLFKAIVITGHPHLMAKVGAWLMIVLGLINLQSYLWPKSRFKLGIPKFSQATLKKWLYQATLPAVIVAAFLVGLCVFPCSGGPYVATVSLLAFKETFFIGLMYLLAYNLMFVVPLLFILFAVGNRAILAKVGEWQMQSKRTSSLIFGLFFALLGIIILMFFV